MDTSQLMRLATQAGFTSAQRSNVLIMESLKVFARAIEHQAREECALLCDEIAKEYAYISEQADDASEQLPYADKSFAASNCAVTIRNGRGL